MNKLFKQVLVVAYMVLLCGSLVAQQQAIPLSVEEWEGSKAGSTTADWKGQAALRLGRGVSWNRNIVLCNGIIEADIALTDKKSMAGIVFRGDNNGNYEELYIRPHKSGFADAIQYGPVYHHESGWQLYPDLQAKYNFSFEKGWVHLRVVVQGEKASVYVDEAEKPLLEIKPLRTGNACGKIGLWALSEAYFANVRYTPLPREEKAPTAHVQFVKDVISSYDISQVFTLPANHAETIAYPSETAERTLHWVWQNVPAESDGLLNIARYAVKTKNGMDEANSNDYVWIRFFITAEKEGYQKLQFEFTNRCWLYCNGQPLYSGDNSFHLRGPMFRGELQKEIKSNAVYLPLKKGKNEIRVAVSSVADGWGWMGKLPSE